MFFFCFSPFGPPHLKLQMVNLVPQILDVNYQILDIGEPVPASFEIFLLTLASYKKTHVFPVSN
jgi:hypothetical protein